MTVAFSSLYLFSCAGTDSPPETMTNVTANLEGDTSLSPIVDMQTNTIRDMNIAMETRDLYIPPPEIDMATAMPEEPVELTLRRCVQRMLDYLDTTRMAGGCDDFQEIERADPGSPYAREAVAAACIQLECTGLPLDGHNGIPTTRSCLGLDNLMATLEVAEQEANDGICGTPVFQVKVIPLDQFMGPESCDALICGLEADGEVISLDQRN